MSLQWSGQLPSVYDAEMADEQGHYNGLGPVEESEEEE